MYGKEISESKLNPQFKNIKQLDLQTLQKPKTLIILHYKSKRISVPLFQETFNLSSLLNHHIIKLQQAILSKSLKDASQQLNNQIVCFEIKKDINLQLKYHSISDGDLRSDILLSLLRVQQNQGRLFLQELKINLDVTKIYKYLQIQPYYRYQENQISQIYHEKNILKNTSPYFHFYRLLSQTNISSTFLARKISNGHFYSVKVYSQGMQSGQEDRHHIQMIQKIDELKKDDSNIKCSLLVRSHNIMLIPHPEIEQSQQSDNESSCKYISIIFPYFVKGTLQDLLKDARFNRTKRIAQMDCLNYLKQLMWGAYLLHQKYNLIHRTIVPANLYIDHNGQLRLTNYSTCLQCYDSNGNHATYTQKSKRMGSTKRSYSNLQQLFENGQYDLDQYTPPQIIKGYPYNYLVDFYTIGVIIRKLYQLSQAYQRAPISQNNENLMMTMINRLTSSNLSERADVVNQIIQDIERENLQNLQSARQISTLVLQDIKVGKQIQNNVNKKFIENDQSTNGIDLNILIDYFHEPKLKSNTIIKSSKKEKRNSKQKLSTKNSRQKSQKCLSKGSIKSSSKDHNSIKGKSSFEKQLHQIHAKETKLSRQTSNKYIHHQSPISHKKSKSKSHQKKKISQKSTEKQAHKLWAQIQQKKKSQKSIQSIPTLPKSPKAHLNITRNKSPGQRDK